MDPLTRTRTSCLTVTRHCTVGDYYAPTSAAPRPEGPVGNGKRSLSRENLGADTIDGLYVVGTRETLTINTGVEGNSAPLSSIEESWYSPELEVNLSVTRKDPRKGTVVIHVVDLTRSEPEPSLFQVPANFAVEDHRQSAKTEN